jgi:hypothetical protein|nr:MAG TPA: hypothetical protein [Caudoviricetes sp.]
MRNFYSGISNDKTQFLINMNWYKDNDVEACFRLSKNFHGLPKNCSIEKNDFELVYLKFEWIGNTYYPQESDKSEGQPIRVYKIKM